MSVKQNRNAPVRVMLTLDELKTWRTKATLLGISLSQMVRNAVSKVEVKSKVDKDAIAALQSEIRRIGNNINQLARWANSHKLAGNPNKVEEVLKDILSQLEKLAADVT